MMCHVLLCQSGRFLDGTRDNCMPLSLVKVWRAHSVPHTDRDVAFRIVCNRNQSDNSVELSFRWNKFISNGDWVCMYVCVLANGFVSGFKSNTLSNCYTKHPYREKKTTRMCASCMYCIGNGHGTGRVPSFDCRPWLLHGQRERKTCDTNEWSLSHTLPPHHTEPVRNN